MQLMSDLGKIKRFTIINKTIDYELKKKKL